MRSLSVRVTVLAVLGVVLVDWGGESNSPTALARPAAAPAENSIDALRRRANAGDATAQFNLGFMYDDGKGVVQDYAQALAWYRKAAEQGHAVGQYNLGVTYDTGKGVVQDDAQAVVWFRKAAAQGDAAAQYNLGRMYSTGKGVPKDYVEAHKWRNLAAAHASAENQKAWARVRDAVEKEMTPQQVADAQTLAREWLAAFEKRVPPRPR